MEQSLSSNISDSSLNDSFNHIKLINRLGRKKSQVTKVLSLFFSQNKTTRPRKEFFRCLLLRMLTKLLRNIRKNKLPYKYHPLIKDIINLFNENAQSLSFFIDKKNAPFVDNKTNNFFKSYNDHYCKFIFSSEIVHKVYLLFIEYSFQSNSIKQISQRFRIFCCKNECQEGMDCKIKWEKLKNILIQESFINNYEK